MKSSVQSVGDFFFFKGDIFICQTEENEKSKADEVRGDSMIKPAPFRIKRVILQIFLQRD
jgi:hypothetical protein